MKHAILFVFALSLSVFACAWGPSSMPSTGDWAGVLSWVLYAFVVMIGIVVVGKVTKKAIKRHRQKHGKK